MDLGIGNRVALVCASSKGIGKGCAAALAAEGIPAGHVCPGQGRSLRSR